MQMGTTPHRSPEIDQTTATFVAARSQWGCPWAFLRSAAVVAASAVVWLGGAGCFGGGSGGGDDRFPTPEGKTDTNMDGGLADAAALPDGAPSGDGSMAGDAGTLVDGAVEDGAVDGAVVDAGSPAIAINCRHGACEPLDPVADGAAWFAGYRYRADGRGAGPLGQCTELGQGLFETLPACEAIDAAPLPFALFYGGYKTWGSLALRDDGAYQPTVEAVSTRFGELCTAARAESGLGADLPCHADLIGYAPAGHVASTERVAERLIADHGASITIDMRPPPSMTYATFEQVADRIFRGESPVVSEDFLRDHPIGLSLDFENSVVGGIQGPAPAAVVNRICRRHQQQMVDLGHDPAALTCFVYDFAGHYLVADPEHLDPSVFPINMGIASGTMDAIARKERAIDATRSAYTNAERMGCMFFTAPYLSSAQRDGFDFADAYAAFGHRCGVIAYQ